MKKLLISLALAFSLLTSEAQLALNEVFPNPGNAAGKAEFFELYNNAQTNISINLDCYTMLVEIKQGANLDGFYVIDFPSLLIAPDDYIVAAPVASLIVQSPTPTYIPDINWSNMAASGGSVKKCIYAAGVWTISTPTPAELNDLFEDQESTILLYKENVFQQALIIKENTSVLSTDITGITTPLTVSTNGACTSRTYDFAALASPAVVSGKVYSVGPATGSDNGYARLDDGNCSPWAKTAPSINHTPGTTNNDGTGTPPGEGEVNTLQGFATPACQTQESAKIFYRLNTTAFSGTATEGSVFPMTVTIFNDNTPVLGGGFTTVPNGIYDPGVDVLASQITYNSSADLVTNQEITVTDPTKLIDIVILYTTSSGCFDRVFFLSINCSTLPVNFKSFTAARSNSNVLLKWETTTEINSYGFMVERNINGTWQEVVFVPSQAAGGNSNSLLTYTLSDLNTAKGISQYRIKQLDIDGQFKYSEIRPVAGDGQRLKTVVYPNPSSDGRVNILFDDSKNAKDIVLIDAVGRILKQWKTVTNNNLQIDNLAPGVYNLRIVVPATGEKSVERIIVAKQ